eukprot:8577098-Karenia_brevis.AAC.1
MDEAVAEEMVGKVKKLSKDGVEVNTPKVAVETAARSDPSGSSKSWSARRTYNPNLKRPPGMPPMTPFKEPS